LQALKLGRSGIRRNDVQHGILGVIILNVVAPKNGTSIAMELVFTSKITKRHI
jgi:hypothetical protein